MAQGAIKKTNKAALPRRPSAPGAKKGQRSIAPKKKNLVSQQKITKKYTSGLIGKTERGLAEKVGHLEMLAGGKKRGGDVGGKKKEKAKGK